MQGYSNRSCEALRELVIGVNRWQRSVKRLPEGGLLKYKVGRHGLHIPLSIIEGT